MKNKAPTQMTGIRKLWLAILCIGFALATLESVQAREPQIVCVWPDGTQTLPDYYTNTCPMGSVPMRR